MTIYTCGELKPRLLEVLAAHDDVTSLDLSRVVELDTAGLQVLLTARAYAAGNAGKELSVANPSKVVSEVLELCRLNSFLLPTAATAAES